LLTIAKVKPYEPVEKIYWAQAASMPPVWLPCTAFKALLWNCSGCAVSSTKKLLLWISQK